MSLREEPLRSRKYRDASRGQPCTLRCSPRCDGGGETTVFAHILDRHAGKAQKASDTSGADSCGPCHDVFDGRAGFPLSRDEWHFFALRGLQETLENRVRRGIAVIALDLAKPASARPTPKRIPKSQRNPIPQPVEIIWPSRPIPKRQKERT